MGKRVEALVKPELLTWARKSAGFEIAAGAKKARVKAEQLRSWERGDKRPTINQLRSLGRVYKRPLAVFFLPEPPLDFEALRDFRRLPGRVAGVQSPELRFEIRRAYSRRELAIELYEPFEGIPPAFPLQTTLSDDPERLGTRIRETLGIRYEDQIGWTPGYDAFNHWRSALENSAVLVFQATEVDVSEVRGFSISDPVLPAIVLNTKDNPPQARIFTMLHELCHIVLREGGLCDLDEESRRPPEELGVEVFCNHVAGAALVPKQYLLTENLVRSKQGRSEWSDEEIAILANRYGVGREVLLRRLLICDRTTNAFYRRKREQFQEEYEEQAERRGRGGFAPPYQVAVSAAGPLFVRLVLSNYYQENITPSDVSDLLEVRLKHLPKIESIVLGKSAGAEAIR